MSFQTEATKEMQQNLMEELIANGAINNLQVIYLSDLLQAIVKSKNKRLKPSIKPKNDKANAIAMELVLNYLKNHPTLPKSLIAVETEIKEFKATASNGKSGEISIDIMAWDEDDPDPALMVMPVDITDFHNPFE